MSIPAKQQTAERERYPDDWLASQLRSATDSMPDDLADNASDTRAVLGAQASAGDDAAANTCQCASARRDQSPQARLHAADQRDVTAYTRDQAALTRDGAADARGLKLAQRDAAAEHDNDARAVTGSEVIVLAAGKRKRASRRRAQTAEQDARAAEDRHAAAGDREQAALERVHALVDSELLANALALAANDALTGARARAAGLAELDGEVDLGRRTGGLLVVAYVDIVGLKALKRASQRPPGGQGRSRNTPSQANGPPLT